MIFGDSLIRSGQIVSKWVQRGLCNTHSPVAAGFVESQTFGFKA